MFDGYAALPTEYVVYRGSLDDDFFNDFNYAVANFGQGRSGFSVSKEYGADDYLSSDSDSSGGESSASGSASSSDSSSGSSTSSSSDEYQDGRDP